MEFASYSNITQYKCHAIQMSRNTDITQFKYNAYLTIQLRSVEAVRIHAPDDG